MKDGLKEMVELIKAETNKSPYGGLAKFFNSIELTTVQNDKFTYSNIHKATK